MTLGELAEQYFALQSVDKSDFQRSARILQSMWRVEQGYGIGELKTRSGSKPLGSRLAMPRARDDLLNYLSDTIKGVVCDEVIDPVKSRGKLYGKPRIFNDLLSSQPLCFNLFAELQKDLPLATDVMRSLTDGLVGLVTGIDFEWSPGRGDPRLTGDRSAFDVYVSFLSAADKRGFIGIEVKYHENLIGAASPNRDRYDQIADQMGCFKESSRKHLKEQPLQQIWRDHLLAGIHRIADGFEEGFFVFLYPGKNTHCSSAIADYERGLTNTNTFASWTIESVASEIKRHTDDLWIDRFIDRYLAFEKITTGE